MCDLTDDERAAVVDALGKNADEIVGYIDEFGHYGLQSSMYPMDTDALHRRAALLRSAATKLAAPAPAIDPEAVWEMALQWAMASQAHGVAIGNPDGQRLFDDTKRTMASARNALRALLGLAPEE